MKLIAGADQKKKKGGALGREEAFAAAGA